MNNDTNGHLPAEDIDALLDQILFGVPRPVDWVRLPAAEAPAHWVALAVWVHWLVDRYALSAREVPPCWYQHGALVEELSALRCAHLVAYDPTQAASAAADWHRTLWEARMRLRDWCDRHRCTTTEHRPDSPQPWTATEPAADDAFTAHVQVDTACRREAEAADAISGSPHLHDQ